MVSVLVIEDNPVNMKLALLLLHGAGHTALCAVAMPRPVWCWHGPDQSDLILMDVQLPGMDGLAAAALLNQGRATAAIPIFFGQVIEAIAEPHDVYAGWQPGLAMGKLHQPVVSGGCKNIHEADDWLCHLRLLCFFKGLHG
jgi:CheY-like chemotaxis protein